MHLRAKTPNYPYMALFVSADGSLGRGRHWGGSVTVWVCVTVERLSSAYTLHRSPTSLH
jgi:hypothetical protein